MLFYFFQYVPPDLCICNFVLEQSLSVRALQEMLAHTRDNSREGVSTIVFLWHCEISVLEKSVFYFPPWTQKPFRIKTINKFYNLFNISLCLEIFPSLKFSKFQLGLNFSTSAFNLLGSYKTYSAIKVILISSDLRHYQNANGYCKVKHILGVIAILWQPKMFRGLVTLNVGHLQSTITFLSK